MINISHMRHSEYCTNTHGYRAPEFDTVDWNNSYIIQGCSAVYGLGLQNDSETVSANLSAMLGCPVVNLGIAGSGIQVQYMNAIELLEQGYRPKGVFIIWPNPDRYPLLNNGVLNNIGPWSKEQNIDWMLEDNSKHHNLYHVRAYRLLWKLANVPVYEITHHSTNTFCLEQITEYIDRGNDGQHWGPITATAVASRLYKQVR